MSEGSVRGSGRACGMYIRCSGWTGGRAIFDDDVGAMIDGLAEAFRFSIL